ncbi:MAG: glycosyltransferase [Rhodanobacteraceae bacterium]
MRILHLGKYYAPERGGIERTLQALSEWTVARGEAVGVLVHQRPGVWRSSSETIGGVDVRRVACLAAPVYTPLSPTFPFALARALREFEPDVLHLHLPNPSCFAALFSARARRIPWVVHWHSDIPPDAPDWRLRLGYRAYRPFEQAMLKRAKSVIATSQSYLDASGALAPWCAKAVVIPLGIEDVATSTSKSDLWPAGNGLRLLAVGRLSHYKGFDVLIDALAKARDARLVLVGDGESNAMLRARALERGIESRMHFTGALGETELLAAYAAADAFVLPSLNRGEAFGLVLLEAMRSGLPVIASAIPGSGVGEVVVDGETGVLVPPNDRDALASAIARFDDAPLRTRLGNAGRERWAERFTLERSAQRVLALYRELADRKTLTP